MVVNPKATTTTAGARDVLARALSSESRLEVVETKARGHATELAQEAAAEGLDVVVALGGDGTVNEVVNGLLAHGPGPRVPAFGVVPGGSANVFARAVGLADDVIEATHQLIDALRAQRTRSVGLGLADDRWFTFCAGLGLDADVVRRVEQRRSHGVRATTALYVRSGVSQFFRTPHRGTPGLVLERDGADPTALALALVCNTRPWTYLGSRPVVPCPKASFDTGLDVFGLHRLRTPSTLRHLAQILSSSPRPGGRDVLALHDVPAFTVRACGPVAFQVDGDDLGDRTAVTFRAVPRALRVLV